MTLKLEEIFEEIDIDILRKIMLSFCSGEIEFKYSISIVDISKSLRENGIMTKSEKENYDRTGIDWSKMKM